MKPIWHALAALLLLSAPLPLASQTLENQDYPTQTQEPARKQQALTEAQQAAAEAQKRQLAAGEPEATYEQVLADPDNVDLNLRYARRQIREGRLRGASASLERVLLKEPGMAKVRLLRAGVLLRLDTIDEAQRELEAARSRELPGALKPEADGLEREIRRRRRKTRVHALLGVGLDFDENRNAAPSSGQRLFLGNPIILDANSTRKSDTGKVLLARAGAARDLGLAGHRLFANVTYYRAEQTQVRTLNLQSWALDAGATFRAAWSDVTPSVELGHLLLAQTTYLRSGAAGLRFDRRLSERAAAFAELAFGRLEYSRTAVVPTADQRTGNRGEGTLGATFAVTPSHRLTFSYGYEEVGARLRFNELARHSLTLGHAWVFGGGQFLLSSVTGRFDRYAKPDAAISPKLRSDDGYRARVTYGLPLGRMARALRQTVWTLGYEYYHALSNVTNYGYTNNKVSTMLTQRWEL